MATELGQAYVQIVPSAKGISGGITSALNNGGIAGAGTAAGKSIGSRIASGIRTAIAAAGIGVFIKSAITEAASLEQSIGGIETLFKGSADTVKAYANNAYQSVGMSANEYMENVTGFSATLLQGLEGDTKKAASIAHIAMVDMADNANKMGTDMEMITNAYQGFARDNYVMLDNLKLGYSGTADEMARLINDSGVLGKEIEVTAKTVRDVPFDKVIEAIHKTQDKLDITGTTAKEAATTFTGSFNAMKAAAQNFMANLMLGEDIQPSLKALMTTARTFVVDNLFPMLKNMLKQLPEAIDIISTGITPMMPDIISGIGMLISAAASGLIQFAPALVSTMLQVGLAMIGALKDVDWGAVAGEIMNALGEGFKSNAPAMIVLLTALGIKMAGPISNLGGTIGGLVGKIKNLGSASSSAAAPAASAGNSLSTLAKNAGGILAAGASILLVATGFAIMAHSAIALADAGWLAIAVMGGMIVVIGALAVGVTHLGKTAGKSLGALTKNAVGIIAVGAGLLLVAASFALLAQSAIALANAGWPAVAVMGAMIAIIAGLAIGAAALAPALATGAAGLIAFGAGMILIGLSVVLVCAGLALLATQLPVIAEYGLQASVAILALSGALLLFGVGALVAGAGALILGAGLTVAAIGLTLVGVAVIVVAAGILILAAGVTLLAVDILMISAGLMLCSAALSGMGGSALAAAVGMTALGASALLAFVPFVTGAISIVAMTVALAALTIAVGASAIAMAALLVAVSGVAAKMSGISNDSTTAANSLKYMVTAIDIVKGGLDGLKSKVSNSFDSAVKIVNNSSDKIKSSLKNLQTAFANTKFKFNQSHIAIPHFSMSGSFNAETGTTPSVSVRWYKKAATQGALFSTPSIIGVGDAAQPEMLIGIDTLSNSLSRAVTSGLHRAAGIEEPSDRGSIGDITIPVYIGQNKIEDIVVRAQQRVNYRSGGR